MRALIIIGTRPEGIKLAPLHVAMSKSNKCEVDCCITSQHRELLHPMLDFFGVKCDYDLHVMSPGQTLVDVTTKILKGVTDILKAKRYDVVIVQGDTSTAFVGALAAFYERVPIAHVEAGLRSFDLAHPFPEEGNRRFVDVIADHLFVPTEDSVDNLMREGVDKSKVHLTGNTGIDALLVAKEIVERQKRTLDNLQIPEDQPLLLVTAHRRESFGEPLERVFHTIVEIVRERPDLHVLFPLHPNPNVRQAAARILDDQRRIHLTEPFDYPSFVTAMLRSDLILTDSGGVQEEAPTLGKPVLVIRETTERPEGVDAGVVELVGTDPKRIHDRVSHYLDQLPIKRPPQFLYGDGKASQRIVDVLVHWHHSKSLSTAA